MVVVNQALERVALSADDGRAANHRAVYPHRSAAIRRAAQRFKVGDAGTSLSALMT